LIILRPVFDLVVRRILVEGFWLRAIFKGSNTKLSFFVASGLCSMCGVGAFVGQGFLRHGAIKKRLWRRGVCSWA
jgi:hypothetical protein